jgi:nitroreductase
MMSMLFKELVKKTRSYRRFKQDPISRETLVELVDLARLSASSGNDQPLKYILSHDSEMNARIFPCAKWAGRLKNWKGPACGEHPTAYIVILLDTEIARGAGNDVGIAAQSIVLGAMERGIGACMIGALDRAQLVKALDIASRYQIELVVALGVPAEKIVLEDLGTDKNIAYYRDANDVHHVPKRSLADIILR